jgi:nitrite reductase/ring-hydroxylating ferredoxin subunit
VDFVTGRISRRIALAGAVVLGVAVPTLAACGGSDSGSGATPKTGSKIPTADVPVGSGAVFTDDGVVVTQPTEGTFVGFKNVCTHQGCVMRDVTATINCSCHGSQFSIKDGTNVTGPNGTPAGSINPLPEVKLTVQGDEISIA